MRNIRKVMATVNMIRQQILLSLTILTIYVAIEHGSKAFSNGRNGDSGLLFKPRDQWTNQEKIAYEACRKSRKRNGKSIKEFWLIQHVPHECNGPPLDAMEITSFSLIDAKTRSKALKFPGCYSVVAEMNINKSHPLVKEWKKGYLPNLLGYVKWSYNTGEKSSDVFNELDCKNKDIYGCGGAGNKCSYCNMCKSVIEKVQTQENISKADREECPRDAGFQTLRKNNICIDDWGTLDKDNDGEPDFVCYPEFKNYAELLHNIGVEGYGNIHLRFTLSKNNTREFRRQKKKLGRNFPKHYRTQLPRIRRNRMLGCVDVAFDICTEKPDIGPDGKPHCSR